MKLSLEHIIQTVVQVMTEQNKANKIKKKEKENITIKTTPKKE